MKSVILEQPIPDVHGGITFTSNTVNAKPQDFQIDENAIGEELTTICNKIAYYGDINAQAQSQLARHEENVKRIYHTLSAKFRSGQKLTENGIKDLVVTDPTYQSAIDDLCVIRESAKLAESWWRTIQEKANVLRTISNRQMTELKVSPY